MPPTPQRGVKEQGSESIAVVARSGEAYLEGEVNFPAAKSLQSNKGALKRDKGQKRERDA
jgi:hypothetical protein